MPLLTLQDIGKIYVSEGAVAVGIRGVNLSFERGEFVAVTGKSGSGKSTLLNVISGMDSYEEGELIIEGETTSHYLQADWEAYREKYISFIFQDYNIIESFTVLENVELALMHIENKKERRKRALDLLARVGMTSHIKQKGSKLSGGQKQRTVIARALAKDSPIILADEPTGNLDSHTSREIIELLREVSRDKLLIVVTHNFEEVEACATRHIRIFDGAVESDHVLKDTVSEKPVQKPAQTVKGKSKKAEIKNGLTLGRSIFTAKPKLSTFLCLLMIVGMLGIFFATAFCGEASALFDDSYMFTPIDGRVVLTKQNGAPFTDDEVSELVKQYGAKDYLRFDELLDTDTYNHVTFVLENDYKTLSFRYTYGKDYGSDIIGRYPDKMDEVFLYLPIYMQPIFGEDTLLQDSITLFDNAEYKVTGVKYYYDNNKEPECVFTHDGFRTATALLYLLDSHNTQLSLNIYHNGVLLFDRWFSDYDIMPCFSMEEGKIYIADQDYRQFIANYVGQPDEAPTTEVFFQSRYYRYDHFYGSSKGITFTKTFQESTLTDQAPVLNDYTQEKAQVYIHPSLLMSLTEEVLSDSYRQLSLFFEDNDAAEEAAAALRDNGFIAVPANTAYEPDGMEMIATVISSIMLAVVWLGIVCFLGFFINLCTSRTLSAFKNDMAIMRSMGISVRVIRVGMYVRMLISMIPAVISMVLLAILIFISPTFNEYFTYLYPWQYGVIVLGMLILVAYVTHRQIRRLFGESVKKSLKGGTAE